MISIKSLLDDERFQQLEFPISKKVYFEMSKHSRREYVIAQLGEQVFLMDTETGLAYKDRYVLNPAGLPLTSFPDIVDEKDMHRMYVSYI